MQVSHSDDKSAVDIPNVTREAQAQPLEKLTHQVHGDFDKSANHMYLIVPSPGVGSKDSNLVVEELLMHAARTLNGEAVDMVIADCASLNACGATSLGLPQFKVDLGLVKFSLFFMLQQLDSKEACDRASGVRSADARARRAREAPNPPRVGYFGTFHEMFKKSNLLIVDHLLKLAEDTGSTSAYCLNPYSLSDFADWFKNRYHVNDVYVKELGFGDSDIHLVVFLGVERLSPGNVDAVSS